MANDYGIFINKNLRCPKDQFDPSGFGHCTFTRYFKTALPLVPLATSILPLRGASTQKFHSEVGWVGLVYQYHNESHLSPPLSNKVSNFLFRNGAFDDGDDDKKIDGNDDVNHDDHDIFISSLGQRKI